MIIITPSPCPLVAFGVAQDCEFAEGYLKNAGGRGDGIRNIMIDNLATWWLNCSHDTAIFTDPLLNSLKHFPVALLTGARQVGKSTLAQELIGKSWSAVLKT